jgi:preprotein translocase subunit SecA
VEYQREGYDMFASMMEGIKEESVGNLFNLQVEVQPSPIVEETPGELPSAPALRGQAGGNGAAAAGVIAGRPAGGGAAAGARRPGAGGPGAGGPGAGGPGAGRPGSAGTAAPGEPGAAAGSAGGGPSITAPGLARPKRQGRLSYSAPTVDGAAQVERRTEAAAPGEFGKVGRNAPCPCGSGRKYKQCHGDPRNRPAG